MRFSLGISLGVGGNYFFKIPPTPNEKPYEKGVGNKYFFEISPTPNEKSNEILIPHS